MGVVVFDADVLIGYLEQTDAHHFAAVARVRRAVEGAGRLLLSVVNYSELLVRPLQTRRPDAATATDAMLAALAIELIPVDRDLARRAAGIRARTKVALPDAYAIATALDEARPGAAVELESFDRRVLNAYAKLRAA